MMMKITLAIKISDHPLYKIFGDIPARSADLTHASVRHYFERCIFLAKNNTLWYSLSDARVCREWKSIGK
jgi:hypothetical protein